MRTEKVTILAFKQDGEFYSEHFIEVPKDATTYQICSIVQACRNEYPLDAYLLICKTDNPNNNTFTPHLIMPAFHIS